MNETKVEENIIDFSTFNDHDGDLKKAYHGDVVRCYAVIGDENDFGIRINSLQGLCQANWLVNINLHYKIKFTVKSIRKIIKLGFC